MKYVKILAVAAVTAAALMAFAGTASATEIELEGGSKAEKGTTLTSMLKEGSGEAVLKSSFIGEVKCKESTVEGEITEPGGTGKAVSGPITSLTFTNCNAKVEVLKKGTLEITGTGEGNGSLTSSGAEVTTELSGLHCIFSTNNTSIGTVAGGMGTEMNVLTAKSAAIPRTGGRSGAFCGSSATWNATYEVTSWTLGPFTFTVSTVRK